MLYYEYDNFADIYRNLLVELSNNPQYQSQPRDLKINEILNVSFTLTNPLNAIYKNERRSSPLKYIAAETIWYFNGDHYSSFISKYAKFWNTIKNLDDTINSAYGYLVFKDTTLIASTQWNWCINSLIKDKDSRQALIHFNNHSHQYSNNKDFPCTLYAIFHIRDNTLNMTVHMRSCDIIKGLPSDIVFFTLLQQQMFNHLKTVYKNLELGTYTHIVDSLHLYESNFILVKEMLEYSFENDSIPQMNKNFINLNGFTTQDFNYLSSTINDKSLKYDNDELYKFLQKNINLE